MKAALVYSVVVNSDPSLDNQDTLVQMEEICTLLKHLGIQTQPIALNHSFAEFETKISLIRPDFIFNLVETVNGTDGLSYTAAAFFEYMNIPYTGCPATVLGYLSSKIRQKKMLLLAGLLTPAFITEFNNAFSMGGPWIVKSDAEHASVGLNSKSVVETLIDAKNKMLENTTNLGGRWFAERYIEGREFNLSLLGNQDGNLQTLPAAEILFVDYPVGIPKIVDYAAKWETESFGYSATQRQFDFDACDKTLLTQLERLSRKCWDLFELKGAARIDFRVDTLGNPWILEVNPNPCLSSDAGFMAAAKRKGMSPQNVIKRLLPI